MKTEILYGIHPVCEALVAGRRNIYEIYLQKDNPSGRLDRLASLAADRGIGVKSLESADLKALVGVAGHQGAAAKVDPLPLTAVSTNIVPASLGSGTQAELNSERGSKAHAPVTLINRQQSPCPSAPFKWIMPPKVPPPPLQYPPTRP